MSEKEKNTENNQKKFDLQDSLIDYAVRFWLPSPCLVTNTTKLFPLLQETDELISILFRRLADKAKEKNEQ
ncbi:MAG: hypothetical protein RAP70_05445 [Candidatus Celaenobacter antarcticus]|nr:hypothetical protein [Candidatus Celaenobacter antarcticus]